MIVNRCLSWVRRLAEDRDGAILPIVALSITMLIGATAVAVDFGVLFHAKRKAQGAADLAALVAAQTPGQADAAVRRSLADNGFATPSALTIESGIYVPDASLAAGSRFQPGGATPNAVRVTMATNAPLVFGRMFMGRDQLSIGAKATASRADVAEFTIGSRLLSVNGGIANAVLGALLGTNVSLTAMDYQALAQAKLDAFKTIDALATRAGVTAGTYDQALSGNASLPQVLGAMADAAIPSGASTSAASALRALATAVSGSTARVPLSGLLGLGGLGGAAIGSSGGGRSLAVNAMTLLNGSAQLANGTRQVQVDLSLNVPGLTSTKLTLAIGEQPQSVISVNGEGATIHTAQTRLLLEAKITAPLGLGTLYLPLYAEAAQADATLTDIGCPWTSAEQLSATTRVRPGLADLAIASVPANTVLGTGPSPSLAGSATLLDLALVKVKGQARVTIASPAPRDLVFNANDIANSRVKTVTSTGFTSSIASSLLNNLALDVQVLGLGIGIPSSTLKSSILATLAGVTPVLDTALDSTLETLGIGLGQADVWVDAVRCDRSVLVQ